MTDVDFFRILRGSLWMVICIFIISMHAVGQERLRRCSMLEIPLDVRTASATVIAEGRVREQFSFRSADGANICTSNLVEIYKVFKGSVSGNYIEIVTPGGQVGSDVEWRSNSLELNNGETGVFFCIPSSIVTSGRNLDSSARLTAYAGMQGFIRYEESDGTAADPFTVYDSVDLLYRRLQELTGATYRTVRIYPESATAHKGGMIAATPVISSFSPTTSPAGTGALLTINGSNFGASRGTGYVSFRNADNGGSTWTTPLSSAYISWSSTQIVVRIPTQAGTGQIRVTNSDPATGTSGGTLTIPWSWLNLTVGGTAYRTDFVNDNSAGGYTWRMYTGFYADTAARACYLRAFENWRCSTNVNAGPNWEIGPTTTINTISDDNVNVIRFDIGTELPAGVLGETVLRWSNQNCPPMNAYTREIDMVFDSGTNWNFGPGAPTGAQIDFESVALHELGHAMQLAHVINNSAVMHYAIGYGSMKRSLSSDDIAGGDSVLTQSIATNACGPGAMTQLSASVSGNAHICAGGSTDLLARGGTAYSWSPTTGLSDPAIPNPSASPTRTTTYTVTVTNGACYTATRNVTVSVPWVDAGPDITLCPGNSEQIGGTGNDGTQPYAYSWNPSSGLNNPNIARPIASPAATTTYILTVTDAGSCTFRDTVVVTVSSLAADAGSDASVCPGGSTQLHGSASGGTGTYSYSWSPSTGLSDPYAQNPIASPTSTTAYALTVTDGAGCSAVDTVIVSVRSAPTADAGQDRTICFGGSTIIGSSPLPNCSYSWWPMAGLDNPGISNPTASPLFTTDYVVTVTNQYGCTAEDTVTVTIYQNGSNDYTWTGSVDNNWNTIGNWDNICSTPGVGSNVTIPSGTSSPVDNPAIRLNRLVVDNTSGLFLANDIVVDSLIELVGGSVILGNFNVTLAISARIDAIPGRFFVTNGTGALIQEGIGSGLRDTTVIYPVSTNVTHGNAVSIRNAGPPEAIGVRVQNDVRSGATNGAIIPTHVVGKTWFIDDGGAGTPNADVTFEWTPVDETAGFSRSACFVSRYNGTIWTALQFPGPAAGSNPYRKTATGLQAFGAFSVGDGLSGLPVELLSFDAERHSDGISLAWVALSQSACIAFDVQRALLENGAWSTIGSVSCPAQSGESRYTFFDASAPRAPLWYRLVRVDADGRRETSTAMYVVGMEQPERFIVLSSYPNPVSSSGEGWVTVAYVDGTGGSIAYSVTNAVGATVLRATVPGGSESRSGIFRVPVFGLSPGAYFLTCVQRGAPVVQRLLTIIP